ncbi:MAG TPA: transcription-repair coupling factor [Vicinamibacteria bacterium]
MKTVLETSELARAVEDAGLGEIRSRRARGERGLRVTGLMGPARALFEAVLAAHEAGPVLLVVSHERRAAEATADIQSFLTSMGVSREVLPFPALEVDPYRGLSPHFDIAAARARALAALVRNVPALIVTPAAGLLFRTVSPSVFERGILSIRRGQTIRPSEVERVLLAAGYLHEEPVVSPGDFARRGGILDIYPPSRRDPLRLEFVGDVLEEIRSFDPETQRATQPIDEATVLPAREWVFGNDERQRLLDRLRQTGERQAELADRFEQDAFPPGAAFSLAHIEEFRATVFDYLHDGTVLVEEPAEVSRQAASEWERVLESYGEVDGITACPGPSELLLTPEDLSSAFGRSAVVIQEMDVLDDAPRSLHIASQLLPSFRGRIQDFLTEIRAQRAAHRQVHVFVGHRGLAERLIEILAEAKFSATLSAQDEASAGSVQLHLGDLSHGFLLPDLGRVVFAGRDIFDEPPRPDLRRSRKLGRFLSDFRDLKVGDYVVHADHGIGVFIGLGRLGPGKKEESDEFVVLEFQGGDKLYVPVQKLDLLEKYSSSEAARPRLDKLGGTGWDRVKRRVRKSMRDMAQELLRLYAARKAVPGHAFGPDTHWQSEMEDLFEHEETSDQVQAITDVKQDMEASYSMDRLLCGDVGYGKTEVAMRAAFKAVMDGRQVAVLVPTTVLAFQHLQTFRSRFGPFPIRVEMLSRFRTAKEQRAVVKELAAGRVDVVIGTHRLLSKDVQFKNLGLLVVDEEQRFGVRHKERMKQLRKEVDCLTMTATPIPRTLHMSLSGIRDLSVIETPPKDRMAIQTYITRLDAKILTEAIRYELGRGGQVYFVHNRVISIYSVASFLQKLVPEARIAIGHGQMKEADLEETMLRFVRGDFDVLVSTTIIENGLDIPRVNTLIVNRADRFGLSQLYQLRGRVGRSDRRAYAYFLVPDEGALTPVARRRLAAIREFSDLGAGFRIAALDLELRGAGNLLGGEQHGHIDAVGFDLYCKLLEETVRELAGEEHRAARATLNLKVDLRIPESFVPDTNQRISIYKRVSAVSDETAVKELAGEMRDRYGALPEAVETLFEYARLRILAERLGVLAVEREGELLAFRFDATSPVDPKRLVELAESLPGARMTPGGVLKLPRAATSAGDILARVREILRQLSPQPKMSGMEEVDARRGQGRGAGR